MALDSLYSYQVGMLKDIELRQIFTLLADLELPLYHPAVASLNVGAALEEFREHLGGEMTITLLNGIGRKKEVNRIAVSVMERCINELKQHHSSQTTAADPVDQSALVYGALQ
jgi:3-dehydroquinate synthase